MSPGTAAGEGSDREPGPPGPGGKGGPGASRAGPILRPGFLALPVIALMIRVFEPPPDADLYLHLATARWILEHGVVPQVDPFSHTAPGAEWVAHEWLAAVVLAAFHRLGGESLLVGLKALAAVVYLGLVDRFIRIGGVRESIPRAAGLLVAALGAANVIQERPHLVTILGLALTHGVLQGVLRGESWWILAGLPPLYALWGNAHGGYALSGLCWLVAFARAGGRARARLAVAAGACLAALAVSPAGPANVLYPLRYLGGSSFKGLVQEWAAPSAGDPMLWAVIGVTVAALGARWRHEDGGSRLAMVLSGVLALGAVRNVFLVGLFGAPVVARWFLDRLRQSPDGRLALLQRRDRGAGFAGPVVLALGVAIPWAFTQDMRPAPLVALEAIERRLPGGIGGDGMRRLFNDYDLAGYLLWIGGSDLRVFLDSRIDLYERAGILEDFLAINELREGWPAVVARHGVDRAVLRSDHPLVPALGNRGWEMRAEAGPVVVLDAPTGS